MLASEKFACDRQAGGTSADNDEIGLEKRPRREFGEIFYVHRMKSVREGNLLTRALTDKAGGCVSMSPILPKWFRAVGNRQISSNRSVVFVWGAVALP